MTRTAYFVIHDQLDFLGGWDKFCGAYAEESAAVKAAKEQWYHLTPWERKNRFVEVWTAVVPADSENWLNEAFSIACEDGNFGSVFYLSAQSQEDGANAF